MNGEYTQSLYIFPSRWIDSPFKLTLLLEVISNVFTGLHCLLRLELSHFLQLLLQVRKFLELHGQILVNQGEAVILLLKTLDKLRDLGPNVSLLLEVLFFSEDVGGVDHLLIFNVDEVGGLLQSLVLLEKLQSEVLENLSQLAAQFLIGNRALELVLLRGEKSLEHGVIE